MSAAATAEPHQPENGSHSVQQSAGHSNRTRSPQPMPQLNPQKRSARGRLPVIIAISIDAATLIIAFGWLMGVQLPFAGAYRPQEATRNARAATSASPVDPAS